MSEMKHTPGPWDYVPGNEHHGPYVTSDFGSTICDLYTMSNPSSLSVGNGGDSKPISFLDEMAEPNARLIAAAPDILTALRAMTQRYVDLANSGDAGFWDPEEEDEVIAARAAIAKAEGPTP